MSNDRLFRFNHRLDHQREAHLVNVKFLLGILWINLAFDRGALGVLALHALVRRCFRFFLGRVVAVVGWRWVEGWPGKLLTPNDVQVEVVDGMEGAVGVIAIVVHDPIAL